MAPPAVIVDWQAGPARVEVQVWPAGLLPAPQYPVGWWTRCKAAGLWQWAQTASPEQPVDAAAVRLLDRLVQTHYQLGRLCAAWDLAEEWTAWHRPEDYKPSDRSPSYYFDNVAVPAVDDQPHTLLLTARPRLDGWAATLDGAVAYFPAPDDLQEAL